MPKLNISGLNTTFSELKCSANYALIAPLDNQLIELTQSMLSNTSEHIFLLSKQVDIFFESDHSDHLHTLYDEGKLHPFNLSNDISFAKKRWFSKGILNELKEYTVIKNSCVMVHLSSDMFVDYKTEELKGQLTLYKNFSIAENATVVFLISGANNSDLRRQLLMFNDVIDGVVNMTQEASVYSLEYDFWHHSEGVIAAETINYQRKNNQLIVLTAEKDTSQAYGSSATNQDFDEDDVWLVKSAVPAGTKLPAYYKVIEDNDALYEHAFKMKAATLVFAVTRYTDLSLLARECFSLRKQCGRKLKLVIQNVDGVIRHQDECLFLTLGVNLILYSFSEPSRLLSQIQSIQGFQFSRPLPSSIDDVLKYSDSVLHKGYLPLSDFAKQVTKHSDSAANLGVSGVLVVLELLPRIDAIHPLHLFHVKREGDIFSYVDGQVYLYLHACREHDVDSAIKHLFKLDIADFFISKNVIADHFYIQQECRRLAREYQATQVPDYTEQLQENISYIFDGQTPDVATLSAETAEFRKVVRPVSMPIKVILKGEST